MSLPPLPPPPPGAPQGGYGAARPARRRGRTWWVASGAALVLVVGAVAGTAALRDGGDDSDDGAAGEGRTTSPGVSAPTGPSDDPAEEPTDVETTAEDLPALEASLPYELGPVCDSEATLAGGVPWSGEPADLRVLWLLEWPDLPGYNEYDLLGAEGAPWNVTTSPGSWGEPNAVLCTRVVPGTTEVRQRCEGTSREGEPLVWDVHTADLRFDLVEATTGELIARGDPFPAADTLPVVGCAFPPINAVPGEVLPTVGLQPDLLIPLADAFVTGV